MSIELEFKSNGVIIWHSGVVTGEDLILANKDVYSYKYDEGLLFQLADLSDVEDFDVSSNDMATLAAMDKQFIKGIKQFGCTVAPTDVLFGFSRQWNMQAEKDVFHTNVVRSMDEAITWFASKGITVTLEK
ncbi:hypothetical protein ACFL4M_01210 [Pseudomonadota bacterium]